MSVSNALHANPFFGINEPNELIIPFPAIEGLVTTCHTLHYATMGIWRCGDVQVLLGDQSKLVLELLFARFLALFGMNNQIGQRNLDNMVLTIGLQNGEIKCLAMIGTLVQYADSDILSPLYQDTNFRLQLIQPLAFIGSGNVGNEILVEGKLENRGVSRRIFDVM